MDELRFDGRVAVISGAGRGLGRAYALLLANRGAKVVVNDNGSAILGEGEDEGPAQQVVREIEAAGGEALASVDSVATCEGASAIVQSALDAFGRVDILIHNAGNVRYGALDEIAVEDFHSVLDVHLMGAFYLVRAAFPHMKAQNYGRVVLTSSIGGFYGNQACVNYAVSKSGMIGLSNVIALEGEEHGIRSNLILPGAMTRMADGLDTSQYPPLGPELVAPMVGWLAHEDCALSGEALVAIGGRMAKIDMLETHGVFQPHWTIEQVAARMEEIADPATYADLGLHGYRAHLGQSFEMARNGRLPAE
ncbi:SDR family NAD(P)-dependent oxidoreductase [Novosphingobium decolorationis]|uniref:SDR family NAD(P)-dependent oxidoreductase n=1 Tax=Novosphingobium decolorationis TaxID=2698673 RepID=A0ABX8E7U3_9SPHN|nr:SDR family NAD(P)-dependent oxidoreductase [Novosphingobium decolorationis]QVM84664.1 SDR family NAD(P)-dependent oxidoreductase [Novosphingobium decolorationis]